MTGTEAMTVAPTDLRTAREALADTTGTVEVRGAGTATSWAGAQEPADIVLDTGKLTGVLAYNPADMTVAVRAGTPLLELQAELAEQGQRVAFDPARVASGATVGGLVATADSGPLALAHGSMRDLVIGATVVLADGTVARTGGHVIKNVAGYDLAKLLHGSYGCFGLLAEIVLRLHPVAAATATVRLDCGLNTAAEHARTVLASAFEPVALEWAEGILLTRVEGTEAGCETRAGRLAELLGGSVLPEQEALAAWKRHAALVDEAVVRIGCRPSRLPGILAASGGTAVAGLGTGIGTTAVPPEAVGAVHDAVTAVGGTSVTRRRSRSPGRAWGQRPSALRTLRDLRAALDPGGRLCRGRFDNWFTDEQSAPEFTEEATS
ncbi:dehydrogenase [Prauserella marina]|uniref:Glycolate oxidase FAD binding subunit n=1 Tax=Prauserella marina TaxID=530584 RepID=A0A222VIY1_9PSEU|nr:FAD-binding protein [Prauserella marina]ASR33896.1 dehydrogenase [Prauserella marina]PWV82491.1 glycolate oxidase FAD binding subunit [Prauserella marina]SDC70471.1 glycolate oxidase FAD binding subunit [Prauserella marina]